MNELVANAAIKINDTLSVGREKLAQQAGSTYARRAAEQSLLQGATVIEISRLCEAAYEQAAKEITSELVWVVDKLIYPRFKFVRNLEHLGDSYIEQLGRIIDEHMAKAEKMTKAPPNQLGLHLQTVKERAKSHIGVAVHRCRIERVRSLLIKTIAVLISAPVAGYFVKFLISHYL